MFYTLQKLFIKEKSIKATYNFFHRSSETNYITSILLPNLVDSLFSSQNNVDSRHHTTLDLHANNFGETAIHGEIFHQCCP